MFPSLSLPARVAALAAAASAAIALTACGGSGGGVRDAGAGTAFDPDLTTSTVAEHWSTTTVAAGGSDSPCQLITETQAERLLGPVDHVPLDQPTVGGRACTFWTSESLGASSLRLEIADGEDPFDDALGDEPQNIGPEFGSLGFVVEEGTELRLGWILQDDSSVVLTLHSGRGSAEELEAIGETIAGRVGPALR